MPATPVRSRPRPTNPDHVTLRLLAALPMFRNWRDPDLPPDVTRILEQADRQQLMSIAAEALHRLHRAPAK